ncbi:MAG: hypothetical protein ICV63_16740 [Coleofasciculus sp. Co-bin14]|nr:hypothetical protein [Coleofasciculus sp. Co-bin14]
MQVFIRHSLTIGSTGLLLSLLSSYGTLAQNSSCTNFWVNPKTGIQECLDGRANSVPATQNQGQNQAGTVSSDSVNQSYTNQQFDTLPPDQLRPRMPIDSVKAPASAPQFDTLPPDQLRPRMPTDSVKAPASAPPNLGTINGNAGAVRGSD